MSVLTSYQNEMLPDFNRALGDYIDKMFPDESDELNRIFVYHLGLEKNIRHQGKRIRPFLALLCTQGAGGDWHWCIPAAIALELIHNFSLIHDDIEDNGEQRRGKPAVWKKWGLAKGINSGDVMFSTAFHALNQMVESIGAEIAFQAAMLLSDTCVRLTAGQQADIGFEDQLDITVEQYECMIEGKTAALLSASCKMGAITAGQDKSVQKTYAEFGEYLGKAFQVYDDWLGIWGDEKETGKTVSGDLVEGKKSLPVLIGLERSDRFRRRWLEGPIQTAEAGDLAVWLREDGVEEQVSSTYKKWTEHAMDVLSGMKCEKKVKNALEEFANKLLIRKY